MTPWEWVKCRFFGRCVVRPPVMPVDPMIELMEEGLEETRGIRRELQQLRETGIWHQDLIERRYRPQHRRRGKRPDA